MWLKKWVFRFLVSGKKNITGSDILKLDFSKAIAIRANSFNIVVHIYKKFQLAQFPTPIIKITLKRL